MSQSASIAGSMLTPFVGLPMLAQLPPTNATELGAWMLSAAAAVVIIRQGMGFAKDVRESWKEKPAPADTYQTRSAAEAAVTAQKNACHTTHEALNKLIDERNDRAAEERQETRKAIAGLSERIESVLKILLNGSHGRVPR